MKDEKELSAEQKEEIVTEKYSGEKSFEETALKDELEKLAETFRQELNKASEMSEEEFEEAFADELGIIPEEELCACCGEQRRDKSFGEHYEYCADCRSAMKKYPLSAQGIIAAIVMVGLAIFSVLSFAFDFEGYDYAYKAEKLRAEKKLTSAANSYDTAITKFMEKGILPKRIMLNCASVAFQTMDGGMSSMEYVSNVIEEALTETETKLPLYNGVMKLYEENKLLYATLNEFYTLIQNEKFAKYQPGNDELYKEMMAEIEALVDKEVTVTQYDKSTSKKVKADECMVRFCQYMFAYTSEEYDDAMEYMRMVQKLRPSYYWLYGYELGMAELQSGKPSQARALAENMLEQNIENGDAYALHSAIDRLAGNQEKAIEWADKGIAIIPENAELYRYKAMSLCVMGDYEKAKTEIDKAIEIQEYPLAYMVSIIIETELGNNDTARTYQKTLEMQGVSLTDKMNKYLKGEITAEKLFTEGTGDVE